MAVHQHLGRAVGVALGLLKHGELIGIDRLIFVDRGLDVPAGEVSPIAAGKCAGPHAADGNALPVAIVDIARIARHAGIIERLAEGALPGSLRDVGLR